MIHGCHMPSYGGTTANYADLPPAHAPPTIIGEGNVTHMVTVASHMLPQSAKYLQDESLVLYCTGYSILLLLYM
jgi:hypothetical protein